MPRAEAPEHGSALWNERRTQNVWFINCGRSEVDRPSVPYTIGTESFVQCFRKRSSCVSFLYVGWWFPFLLWWLHHRKARVWPVIGKYDLVSCFHSAQKMVCSITCWPIITDGKSNLIYCQQGKCRLGIMLVQIFLSCWKFPFESPQFLYSCCNSHCTLITNCNYC